MTKFREEIIGDCRLILGDCLQVLPTLNAESETGWGVLTDPPYGIADKWKGGGGHGWSTARAQGAKRNEWDAVPPPDTLIWAWRRERLPVIVWGGNYFDLGPARGVLVWNKPERNFSLAECEIAWTNIDMRARVFDYPRSEPGRVHPTQKPVALMQWCLGFLPNAHTIVDPYMGSASTGVACVNLGRNFIGIERDSDYFDIACKRIEEAYKQPRLFEEPAPKPVQEPLL